MNTLSRRVIGAAIEVHRTLGPGYHEALYEAAMAVELRLQGIPFSSQVSVEVGYKGHAVGAGRIDMLVDNALVLELKAIEQLLPLHEAQLLSYLKTTGHRLGLLINFNTVHLRKGVRRVVNGLRED
ncbi:MAG TPA: GxxExxY protein [Tepidiformaceae bacterium]|nr:GxxExxY protein [Tepidiformaceae bacterium]